MSAVESPPPPYVAPCKIDAEEEEKEKARLEAEAVAAVEKAAADKARLEQECQEAAAAEEARIRLRDVLYCAAESVESDRVRRTVYANDIYVLFQNQEITYELLGDLTDAHYAELGLAASFACAVKGIVCYIRHNHRPS
jgi:Golgi nucleoside diphosphatase